MSERRRMEAVYRNYEEEGAAQGRWSAENSGNRHITAERERWSARLLAGAGLLGRDLAVLEIGCGGGAELERAAAWFGVGTRRAGADLICGRLRGARAASPGARFVCADAANLPFAAASWDVVMAVTLFSSILEPALRERVAAEMARVLRPDGSVLWYDLRYRNPANPAVAPVTAAELGRLFPGFDLRLRSLTLLPPLARRLGPTAPLSYPLLAALPPLRGHLLGVFRKRA